jgi:hypothetical protein
MFVYDMMQNYYIMLKYKIMTFCKSFCYVR